MRKVVKINAYVCDKCLTIIHINGARTSRRSQFVEVRTHNLKGENTHLCSKCIKQEVNAIVDDNWNIPDNYAEEKNG